MSTFFFARRALPALLFGAVATLTVWPVAAQAAAVRLRKARLVACMCWFPLKK